MFGLLMFIGFLGIGIIVKDAMFIIAGGVFYIGWQICFLGTTISKLKNESDDISGKKLLTVTLKPIEMDALNRGVTVGVDMPNGDIIYIRTEKGDKNE